MPILADDKNDSSLNDINEADYSNDIIDTLYLDFCRSLSAQIGINLSNMRRGEVERSIGYCADEMGFSNKTDFINYFLSGQMDQHKFDVIIKYFTIGETYFFREKRMFDLLEQELLPGIINSRKGAERKINFWCAGCSTGEEPYSVAILIRSMLLFVNGWNINILATDINSSSMKKARRGLYNQWSFREKSDWIKSRYFKPVKDGYFKIDASIKDMVTFMQHNLLQDGYPFCSSITGQFDIIICRNVLMYFSKEATVKAIETLHDSLSDDGYLIVSLTEVSEIFRTMFYAESINGVTVYKKDRRKSKTEKLPPDSNSIVNIHIPAGFGNVQEADVQKRRSEEMDMQKDKPTETEYYQAMKVFKTGGNAETVHILEKTLEENPADPKMNLLLSRAYANLGRLEEARKYCEKACYGYKLVPEYHYFYAGILQELHEYEEAIIALNKAIFLDNKHVLANFAMGNILSITGSAGKAKQYFHRTLALLDLYGKDAEILDSGGMTVGAMKGIVKKISSHKV